jgi:hypothetical protein
MAKHLFYSQRERMLELLRLQRISDLLNYFFQTKPAGRTFDSRLCHLDFSWTQSFGTHKGPGTDSASKRNEYHNYYLVGKGGRCVRQTTLPPSSDDSLEIWQPHPPGTLRACPGLSRPVMGLLYFNLFGHQ